MMKKTLSQTEIEQNFQSFINELTTISRKYGVAVQAVGGVMLAHAEGEFAELRYDDDVSSNDITPFFD